MYHTTSDREKLLCNAPHYGDAKQRAEWPADTRQSRRGGRRSPIRPRHERHARHMSTACVVKVAGAPGSSLTFDSLLRFILLSSNLSILLS